MNPSDFSDFDSATLHEAAGKTGMVDPAIKPAWPGAKLCGFAFTVHCPPGDNLMLHHAVASAPPGSILVAQVGNYTLKGAWGEILTVAAQARGIAGLIIDGSVRDIDAIAPLQFPIFSRGLAIGACTKERFGTLDQSLVFGGVPTHPGDLVFGDGDGIVIIGRDQIDEVHAAARQRQEFENTLINGLQEGKTTLELLNLPPLPASAKP